ncbi:hypothetical protein CASFOL_006824 [Castilleja foliolosa]|uniref:Protein kinase domain-containing protein n=1 Tax=Castilleja foliolosa TaxID=1961234 RepID=A0ABD3E7K2_9LAMI
MANGKRKSENNPRDLESVQDGDEFVNSEDFLKFQDGDVLTLHEILDAPGEVIGKSSYGTLYKASLVNSNSVALLRFLRPSCTLRIKEVLAIVEFFGSIKHPNLVPLKAFYAGPKGEKLMVHPFYGFGNLAQFIKDANADARKWPVIHKIATGIAKGVHHLHSSFGKPLAHGNLKSKNIFLDSHFNPFVSDFGLHLLLNPTAGQKMIEMSASDGYKAPELIKMKDANEESDIYSLGVIFLELLTGKLPVDDDFSSRDRDIDLSDALRRDMLDDRINILCELSGDRREIKEDYILKFFRLAMACCSPSRLVRPDVFRVLEKLEEIGK